MSPACGDALVANEVVSLVFDDHGISDFHDAEEGGGLVFGESDATMGGG